MTGAAAALACVHRTQIAVLPAFWLTAVLGVGMATIDIRCHRLPHALTGVLSATTAICLATEAAVTADLGRLCTALLTAAATGTVLLLVALALPGQFGLGDVTFASALALSLAWLHWSAAPAGLFASFSMQAVVTLGLRARGRRAAGVHDAVPMGPSLVIGWALVAFLT